MKKEFPKIDPDKIRIESIKTIRGNIEAPLGVELTDDCVSTISFDSQSGISLEEKIVHFVLTVNIQAHDAAENELPIKASYTHQFVFYVENLDEFVTTADGVQLDFLLGAALAGIALSSVRGIILTRTQGTPFDGFILPVIDPKKLISAQRVKSQEELVVLNEPNA
jgi:hypothetical protein